MAKADGRIIIDTAIDADGMEKGAKELQSAAKSLVNRVERLGPAFQKALTGNEKAVSAFRARANDLRETVEKLGQELARLGGKQTETDAYKEMVERIRVAENELVKLTRRQKTLDNRGVAKTSQSYKNLQADIAAAEQRLERLNAARDKMEQSGTAWVSGEQTEEYQAVAAAIDQVTERLSNMQERVAAAMSACRFL